MQQCRPQQGSRVKVLPKNQTSPSFWKNQQWRLENQRWRLKKLENPKDFDLALIPCGENLYIFSYIENIQPMKYIYNSGKERKKKKKKNKDESLQSRNYIQKYTPSYMYIQLYTQLYNLYNCILQLYIFYNYILQL